MNSTIARFFRKTYNRITGSIALYPALIAIGFLALSWLMIELDFSGAGKHIKSNYHLIRLRDASTARSIASTIITGVISLAVFSFSMVMILLNQAASQLSNRMLEVMIGNRFQQILLGLYLGTIVYALFLLSTIRDVDSGVYVPALSIYLLIVLVVADLFVFIYFLHYVTQSVKFETIIKRVHRRTLQVLQQNCEGERAPSAVPSFTSAPQVIRMPASNYFQGMDIKQAVDMGKRNDLIIECLPVVGTYLLQGQPLLHIYSSQPLTPSVTGEILEMVDLFTGQSIESNAYYGLKQLAEVSIKALSPGINDPATAVLSLHCITDLLGFYAAHTPQAVFHDKGNTARLYLPRHSFEDLFALCYPPVWHYGKEDQYIQQALSDMLIQLKQTVHSPNQQVCIQALLTKVEEVTRRPATASLQ